MKCIYLGHKTWGYHGYSWTWTRGRVFSSRQYSGKGDNSERFFPIHEHVSYFIHWDVVSARSI